MNFYQLKEFVRTLSLCGYNRRYTGKVRSRFPRTFTGTEDEENEGWILREPSGDWAAHWGRALSIAFTSSATAVRANSNCSCGENKHTPWIIKHFPESLELYSAAERPQDIVKNMNMQDELVYCNGKEQNVLGLLMSYNMFDSISKPESFQWEKNVTSRTQAIGTQWYIAIAWSEGFGSSWSPAISFWHNTLLKYEVRCCKAETLAFLRTASSRKNLK